MRFKNLTEEVLRIAKQDHVSERDAARIDSLLTNANRQLSQQEQRTLTNFFWGAAISAHWLSLLRDHILNCPPAVVTDKGYQVPVWPAEPYIRSQLKTAEDSALSILFEIQTNNARFYEVVADAAVIVSPARAKTLLPLLIAYVKNRYSFSKRTVIDVLARFAAEGLISEAFALAAEVVTFSHDPTTEEKLARRRVDPADFTTSLEPQPKLGDWEYKEILDKGIRILAKAAPLQSALLLTSAAVEMLRLKSDMSEELWQDTSEIWAPRVDQPERYETDPKAALVRTLTFACEQVYEQSAENSTDIEALDAALREGKWLLFTRVRHHLYAQHPNRAQHWIHDSILEYPNYETWEYNFEFQQMIRRAIEFFGPQLLTREELIGIFERILAGPPKDRFKEFMGDKYTEEAFVRRQRHFQLYQLRPFERVLFGKYEQTYDSLRVDEKEPSDDDYSPYPVGETKTGGSRSPKSADELLAMRDDDLVEFLNEWNDPHRDAEQWWIDVDFQGVGIAFQQAIRRNPERFLAWRGRWHSIKRPIYLSYALNVGTNWLKEKKVRELIPWLDLSRWIMEQPYVRSQTGEQSDSSAEHPDWDSARRAVVDFLEACFTKEAEISIEWRSQLFELTRSASLGPDRYLDNGKALVMPRDYLTDAINTTRGRALENLVRYGFWVREKHRERVEVPEVFEVLERRFSLQPPLTSPEFALLATQFNRLFILSERSARESARFLFPLDDLAVWRISFGQYLSWTHAFNPVFNLLREHFELALESISAWTETDERRSDPIAHLGEHLFAHFIWGNDDLESDTSLLRRFYEKTSSKQWARLFDHVGRLLRNSPADLESGMKQRCKAFFEFRLAARDPEELHEFMFWLEAPSLEVEWRLNAFLRTLDITKGKGQHKTIFVESLSKLLPQQPRLVVECFAKLTEAALHEEYFYIQSDQATPILAVGLKSTDPATREAAERAQDNLLRAGHGEFLNVPESAVG